MPTIADFISPIRAAFGDCSPKYVLLSQQCYYYAIWLCLHYHLHSRWEVFWNCGKPLLYGSRGAQAKLRARNWYMECWGNSVYFVVWSSPILGRYGWTSLLLSLTFSLPPSPFSPFYISSVPLNPLRINFWILIIVLGLSQCFTSTECIKSMILFGNCLKQFFLHRIRTRCCPGHNTWENRLRAWTLAKCIRECQEPCKTDAGARS